MVEKQEYNNLEHRIYSKLQEVDQKCKETGQLMLLDNMEKVYLGSYLNLPKNYIGQEESNDHQSLIQGGVLKEFRTLQAQPYMNVPKTSKAASNTKEFFVERNAPTLTYEAGNPLLKRKRKFHINLNKKQNCEFDQNLLKEEASAPVLP